MNSNPQILSQLRASYRFKAGCAELGISPATGWRLVKAKKLKTVKIAGCTMIPGSEIARLIVEGASLNNSNAA